MRSRLFVFYLLILLLLLSACGLWEQEPPEATAVSITPPPTTPSATIELPTPVSLIPTPAVVTDTNRTLIIWIPPEFNNRTETGANILTAQLLAFSSKYPTVDIKVETKAVSGPGGMFSYLRTGRNVAAPILPDLIIVPVDQLAAAADESLIYPLNGLLDASLVNDLYPAAQTFARDGDQLIGYPFALTDAIHLAYSSTLVTSTLPITWTELITLPGASWVFPAGGREGALLALELYLAAGGRLLNETGQLTLELEPLITALTLLQQGRTQNAITIQSSNVRSLAESWQAYQTGQATITLTSADQYLAQGVVSPNTNFAAIAGPTGALEPLVTGWAWAITTPDETERALAAELIAALVTAEELGRWSQDARVLPARQSALRWWGDDAYTQFSHEQLMRAEALPPEASGTLLTVLTTAVFDVVSANKTPQDAAATALTTIQSP